MLPVLAALEGKCVSVSWAPISLQSLLNSYVTMLCCRCKYVYIQCAFALSQPLKNLKVILFTATSKILLEHLNQSI
jgi:hypothetical protein